MAACRDDDERLRLRAWHFWLANVHAESGRPLSNVQLLARVETELGAAGVVTKVVKQVQSLRVDADHKVLEADIEAKGSSRQFAALCTATAEALEKLASSLDENKS